MTHAACVMLCLYHIVSRYASKALRSVCVSVFFFFQAEDGIRDVAVTGVQTCALPILGDPDAIRREADDAGVTLEEITLANPRASVHLETFAQELWERRRRKGITLREARNWVVDPLYHGLLMLRAGQTDAVVVGVDMYYPDAMRPALEVIGAEPGRRHVSGIRSEEHTSELQSRLHLVCRLLLEKK